MVADHRRTVGGRSGQPNRPDVGEGRMLVAGDVADRGVAHRGVQFAGDGKKLIDLMRGEVHQDAAGGGGIEEPIGAPLQVERVGARTDHVHHLTDRPRAGQANRLGCGPVGEPLGKEHGPAPPGSLDGVGDAFQVVDGGDAGLDAQHMLAALQCCERNGGPLGGDARGDDQIEVAVGEQLGQFDRPGVGPPTLVQVQQFAVGHVSNGFGASVEQALNQFEQVKVSHANHGNAQIHDAAPSSVRCCEDRTAHVVDGCGRVRSGQCSDSRTCRRLGRV